jgi:hypothetical protein
MHVEKARHQVGALGIDTTIIAIDGSASRFYALDHPVPDQQLPFDQKLPVDHRNEIYIVDCQRLPVVHRLQVTGPLQSRCWNGRCQGNNGNERQRHGVFGEFFEDIFQGEFTNAVAADSIFLPGAVKKQYRFSWATCATGCCGSMAGIWQELNFIVFAHQ